MTDSALTGRRVLELADAKGVYCGKLLADLGAEVLKIESPSGDPSRHWKPVWQNAGRADDSLFFLYMNSGKKSLVLDLQREQDRDQFRQLAAASDLIIETLPPGRMAEMGLSYEQLSIDNPALVMTSITGFGQTGPYAQYKTSNSVASAMGGAMGVTGMPEDPPVTLAGSQAYVMGATLAAASSMIALHHASETGQGQQVDISLQEAMLAVTSISGVGKWLDDGIIPQRFGTGLFAAVPSGAYSCKDGSIYLIINRPKHWLALVQWVREITGIEEIADAMFEGPSSVRQPYRELLDIYISELTQHYTVDEFYREGQRRHLAVTPLNTAHGVLQDKHLNARGFFQVLDHAGRELRYPGAPYHFCTTPWRLASPAPSLGGHNGELAHLLRRGKKFIENGGDSQAQALDGLKVVEFGAGMAGPWIGRLMSWCGAEVIKVESKRFPDVTRLYVPPRAPEQGAQSQRSPWLTDWNAGKCYVSLDLTQAEGIDLAKQLIATADVVIDNNASGVLAKLGLDFTELQKEHPELVLFTSTGYGNSGPDAHYISWGPNIETLSGLANLSGFAHRDCTMTQFAYPDPLSALHGLFAIMAAIDYRRRTGKGQIINLCQLEAVIASMGDVMMDVLANDREPEKLGNRSLQYAPQGCYPCQGEHAWCVISVENDEQWQVLCSVLHKPEWLQDARFTSHEQRQHNWQSLDELMASVTGQLDRFALMKELQQAGVVAGVVQDVEDQYSRDAHLEARQFFEHIPHVKKGTVTAPGLPMGLTRTPGKTAHAGKARGADNQTVFCQGLGLSGEQFERYCQLDVIEEPE